MMGDSSYKLPSIEELQRIHSVNKLSTQAIPHVRIVTT